MRMNSTPRLDICGERPQMPLSLPRFHQWSFQDGSDWLEFYRAGDDAFVLRFPGLADFRLSRGDGATVVWSCPPTSRATVEHLFMHQVVPLAQSARGHLMLHGSGIELAGACLVFVGPSGVGKSTLAASFAANGARFLADDGIGVDRTEGTLTARPSHASLRLWQDSRSSVVPLDCEAAAPIEITTKLRLPATRSMPHCADPKPLRCLYLLGRGETTGIAIEQARASTATLGLIQHSFLLEIDNRHSLAGHFDEIARLVDMGLVYHLDYPRRYDVLPAVRHQVRLHAGTVQS
jgi:hypothetical protein